MYAYSLPQWVLFFIFYCFGGWCIETTYVSCCQRKFINRGFLTGPVIPIYGTGAIAILFVALPVRGNVFAIFFLGMLAATVLEYGTGVAMEAIFKVRYWDYSNKKFNLNGHICLLNSLMWGALSVFLVRFLHRPVESLVLRLPPLPTQLLAFVLAVLMAADLSAALRSALDLRRILEQLSNYSEKAKEEARLLQRRLEVVATFNRDTLETQIADYLQARPDGGEAIVRRIEALEQFAARLEQSEPVTKLRTDLAIWRAERAARREQLRVNWSQRHLLRNNPSARSKAYDEQFRLLRDRDREEDAQ